MVAPVGATTPVAPPLNQPARTHHDFGRLPLGRSVPSRVNRPAIHGEATMEMKLRMNVLAALMSFGFVAAVVLGMV